MVRMITISFIRKKYVLCTRLVHSGLHNARYFFTEQNSNTYDRIVRYATIGRDMHWKKKILNKDPRKNRARPSFRYWNSERDDQEQH